MTLARLVVSATVVAGLVGCSSPRAALAAELPLPAATVARLQKADIERVGASLLDVGGKDVPGAVEGRVSTRIRASVNGVAILDDEVREAVGPYVMEVMSLSEPERSTKLKEIVNREINRLVEREVILQDAFTLLGKRPQFLDKLKQSAGREFDKQLRTMKKRYNITSDDELKANLRAQGLTLPGLKRQVERNFMAMEYMRSRIFPAIERITPDRLLAYYHQHADEFEVTDSVKWQDIFIDASRFPNRDLARQFAEDLAAKARGGEDFQQLAQKYDNGDSSYRGGDGFGTRRGEIKPPEAEPVLFKLKDGEVGPVIEQGNGFRVVRLVKREYAGRMPFNEKTQDVIRNKITAQTWEREYKRIVADLRRKATVEIATTTP
jgi:peptidyl-prolyl cis-trans isomerase C